ncbi:MAG: hypothetical protein IJW05_12425 [Lentisphaeria bacterium]|nr:hypothetical protein [Lentisphaeria bacterium]
MPSTEAQLILSCKGTGTAEVNRFNDAVIRTDRSSANLKNTVAGIFSSAAFYRLGKESITLFMRQQAAVEGLNIALKVKGDAYRTLTPELMRFNSAMQQQTIYGDEQIAMIQAQGLNMGITSDRIKEATEAAIGLAAAYDMQLGSAMMLIARASQGQTQMLSRYGIVLGENLSPQEKYAKLLELGASKMDIARAKTKTLEGSLAQMNNAIGDAKESIGQVFAPTVSRLAGMLQGAAEGFNALPEPVRNVIVMTGTMTAAMMALKTVLHLKTIAENIATGSTLTHAGAMTKASVAAKEQERSMASMAEFSSRLKSLEIERKALVENLTRAESDRKKGLEDLAKADEKVIALQGKVDEAQRAYRETKADWLRNPDNKDDYEEVKYRVEELNKLNAKLSVAKRNVQNLEAVYGDLNDAVKQQKNNLEVFDAARIKERRYTIGLTENVAAQRARTAALAQGKSVLEADAAAVAARNAVIAKSTAQAELNAQVEFMRARALSMGATQAEANAVAEAFRTKQLNKSAVASNFMVIGLNKMKIGFRSAAIAAKSLMTSMLPMLALSMAIEAITQLASRGDRVREARYDYAQKEFEAAKQRYELAQKDANFDREKMKRYEELARIQDRTKDEQNELVQITNELNKEYRGLNLAILEQGEILNDVSGKWDVLSGKQKEVLQQRLLEMVEKQRETLEFQKKLLVATMDDSFIIERTRGETFRDDISKLPYEKQIEFLKKMAIEATKAGAKDQVEGILAYIQNIEKLLELRKKYQRLFFGGDPEEEGASEEEKQRKARNEALRDARAQWREETWAIAFRRADREQQLNMLAAKKADYQRELFVLSRSAMTVENIKKRLEIGKQILGIEQQIYDIEQQKKDEENQRRESVAQAKKSFYEADWQYRFQRASQKEQIAMLKLKYKELESEAKKTQNMEEQYKISQKMLEIRGQIEDQQRDISEKVFEELTRQGEAQHAFIQELYQAASGYRETAQSYISANSEQAARMQSRMLMSPEFKMEPQKKMAFTAEAIKALLERWQQQEKETRDAVTEIQKKLEFSGY